MKKVEDLVPGDVLVQDGVRFVVKEIAPLPDGKTAVYFILGFALAAYLNIPLTILGKQNMIAAGYGGAAAFALTFGRMICQKGGLTGAALLYMTVNAGLVIMFGFTVRNEAGKEC